VATKLVVFSMFSLPYNDLDGYTKPEKSEAEKTVIRVLHSVVESVKCTKTSIRKGAVVTCLPMLRKSFGALKELMKSNCVVVSFFLLSMYSKAVSSL
jgi:hypothetical protein